MIHGATAAPVHACPLTTVLSGTIRSANARYLLPRVLAVVIIAFAAAIVTRANDRAASAAALWGVSDTPVVLAGRDIPAGGFIKAAAVTLQAVPVGLLPPPDAIHDLPPSSRSSTGLVAGEILRSACTDPSAASVITSLLSYDHLALSVLAD